jgi:DNA-binding NtrC family response regulator
LGIVDRWFREGENKVTTSKPRVLIVEDDEALRYGLRKYLAHSGMDVYAVATCCAADATFRTQRPDAVILDLQLPDGDGMELLARLQAHRADTAFFMLTGHGSIDIAVRALKSGARDFFTKPVAMSNVVEALRRELGGSVPRLPSSARQMPVRSFIGGSSPAMKLLEEQIEKLRGTDSPVLILGETGTGKSMLARHLHHLSSRAGGPFVDLNCASLSKEFVEAELFGHERGAFTGAHAAKVGLFEASHGGTLFLDEIGDIDMAVQPKVLKVLEEKRFRRMGDVRERAADVRLIAATHRSLSDAITAGTFRSDLYYRISTLYITLPPLRERQGDILTMAEHFLACSARGDKVPELSDDARRALLAHPWPGNVRELRNVLERSALLLCQDRAITAADLRFDPAAPGPAKTEVVTLETLERQHIEQALTMSRGRVEEAARHLGLARSTLYQKVKQYGLVLSRFQTIVPKTG